MKLSDKLNKKFAGKLLLTTYSGRNWLGAKLTGDACGHRQLESVLSRLLRSLCTPRNVSSNENHRFGEFEEYSWKVY